ncbi:MAG: hypothetical protein IPI60_15000 [Saprospiraceae bacterium]|nr:hypothetical protein [Saprospiraceae bacterium]
MLIKALLISLLLLPLILFSQESEFINSSFIVIAPNGLKLREGPGTKFKAIDAAAFGAEVTMLGVADVPIDTVQSYIRYFTPTDSFEMHVEASWMKVKYGKNTGYMYSLYLHPKCDNLEDKLFPHANKSYQLFHRENDYPCINFKSPKQNFWYELIKGSDGNFSLNNIQVEMMSSYTYLEHCGGDRWQLIVQRADRKSNSLVLYSDNKLTPGELNTHVIEDSNLRLQSINMGYYDMGNGKSKEEFYALKNKVLERYSLREIQDKELKTKLFYKRNGKEYLLAEISGPGVSSIEMVSDLDSDGVMDFIIISGDENMTKGLLFLSSEAEAGKSHKLVATTPPGFIC